MGDEWKVVHERKALFRTAVKGILTAGLGPVLGGVEREFTVENESTGETRTIFTSDPSTIGQRIAEGDFD